MICFCVNNGLNHDIVLRIEVFSFWPELSEGVHQFLLNDLRWESISECPFIIEIIHGKYSILKWRKFSLLEILKLHVDYKCFSRIIIF